MAERMGRDTVRALHTTLMAASPCERACLCRCAFALRSHVGRVVYTSLQHDHGVSKRLEQTFGQTASSSVCVDATMRRFAYARFSSYIQPKLLIFPRRRTFRPPLATFADDDGL